MIDETLPPPMFDLAIELPPRIERVWSPEPVPPDLARCGDCLGKLTSLPHTAFAGGASPKHGFYWMCDLCIEAERDPDLAARAGRPYSDQQLEQLAEARLEQRRRRERNEQRIARASA